MSVGKLIQPIPRKVPKMLHLPHYLVTVEFDGSKFVLHGAHTLDMGPNDGILFEFHAEVSPLRHLSSDRGLEDVVEPTLPEGLEPGRSYGPDDLSDELRDQYTAYLCARIDVSKKRYDVHQANNDEVVAAEKSSQRAFLTQLTGDLKKTLKTGSSYHHYTGKVWYHVYSGTKWTPSVAGINWIQVQKAE